jgi:hypothetical protein
MLAPLVVTATVVDHGGAGWAAMAALLAGAGAGALALTRRHATPVDETVRTCARTHST